MSIKDGIRQVKFWLKHNVLTKENVVLLVAVGLYLMWMIQTITAMNRSWQLSETLTRERTKLELLEVEVDTLALENEYYQTAEYQELMARKLLDKKLPGENMVVMPENSTAALTKHATEETAPAEEEEKSNFEKWMMYLFPSY